MKKDTKGNDVKLSDYKGKYVVLEWTNFNCPYVQKHYESKNMQSLQKKYTGKGVVWLTVFSTADGNDGYFPPAELNTLAKAKGMSSTLVLDPKGKLPASTKGPPTPRTCSSSTPRAI